MAELTTDQEFTFQDLKDSHNHLAGLYNEYITLPLTDDNSIKETLREKIEFARNRSSEITE